jgi:hypothetical protein
MKNRGPDNVVINFGHFSETHRVISRPDEVLPSKSFMYAAVVVGSELISICLNTTEIVVENDEKDKPKPAKQEPKVPSQSDRFASARCKPIDYGKLVNGDDGEGGLEGGGMFKNF